MKKSRTPDELYDAVSGARLYTVREAAKLLGYHPFSVYRLVFLGKLRHRRLGPKTLLFSREDLVRYQDGVTRAKRGKPMPGAESALPALTAQVAVDLGGEEAREGGWRQFRWESIPLIRARLDSQYGRRLKGLRISVRGREGEAWKVVYSAPKL
ncbi:MAG: helix-turn-helix domain-containing protein [Elusimicrobia bacterium]|nr:helix-turn-helix domain-containing protein [Elusimicrobiota bacterium]